jgi:hypothetical protein
MGKIQVPEDELLQAVGEGLTDTEIGTRFGLTQSVAINVVRALCRRYSKGRAALMLEWIGRNIDPEGREAADAWELMIDRMPPRSRTLLSELLIVTYTDSPLDFADAREALHRRLHKLEDDFAGQPAPPNLVILESALRNRNGLVDEINTAAQAIGLPAQPEDTWYALVRLAYLAAAFHLAGIINPTPGEDE